MPGEFSQTASALRTDQERGRQSLMVLAVLGFLLILGGLWAVLARVPLYAVSDLARLQARGQVHPVDALVAGRVATVNIAVGGSVQTGDVLMTLDDTDVRLRLDEARAGERGLIAQIAALDAEIAAREEALVSTRSLGEASLSEAQSTRRQTLAEATFARREQARADVGREAGVVAASEADRATAAMMQADAQVVARAQRLSVLSNETRRDGADRRAQIESLRRSLAELVVQRGSAVVHTRRLELELERHTVRAPIDGQLGQVRAPQAGSVVTAGQTIAVVTPETALDLMADFAPDKVIARVRPGQRARMRVAGFPWTQYGMLEATVTAVSSEVSEGQVRVMLALDDHSVAAIPRRHGLTGEVEIEIDEVSPAILVARAAGQLFARSEPR